MIELVDGGVYWVRPPGTRWVNGKTVEIILDEPVLAQYRTDPSYEEDDSWNFFYYFGTDIFSRPREVIVVAGPIDIPPPPEPEGDPQ